MNTALQKSPWPLGLSFVLSLGLACAGDSTASESESDGASTSAATTDGTAATAATGTSTATSESSGSGSASASSSAGTDGTTATTTASTSSSSSSTSTTSTSTSTTATTATTGVDGPSFTEVYEQVIIPQGCNAGYCHGGGAGGLTMGDEATTYANLVEVDAYLPACGLTVRVVPGAPDESILWLRARPMSLDGGVDPCATKMPLGSTGLSEADGQLVFDWIAGGALD